MSTAALRSGKLAESIEASSTLAVTNSYAAATYRQRVARLTEQLALLTEDDKDWVMDKVLVERLRWS